MARRQFMSIFLALVPTFAKPPEGTLVPPVQGAYIGVRASGTANPWDAGGQANFGWREVLFTAEHPMLSYNFVGMEFMSRSATHDLALGARLFVQPVSFLQTSVAYERICYPFGLVSFTGHPDKSEDEIWTEPLEWNDSWADVFSWRWSVHREIGTLQGRISGTWSRIDVDNSLDSLYIPGFDLVARSRDDIMSLDASIGYVTEAPFLAAVGPVYSYTQSVDHEIERGRVGIWMQAWPFSSRSGEFVPFWTLRSRLDLWTTHTSRRWQPRLELTLGWERNIFQPNP